jgi:hypothetical protein
MDHTMILRQDGFGFITKNIIIHNPIREQLLYLACDFIMQTAKPRPFFSNYKIQFASKELLSMVEHCKIGKPDKFYVLYKAQWIQPNIE